MATYYVYHGGNGTDGSSWTNAYQNIGDAPLSTGGDIILVASDHVDANSPYSANVTFTGPPSGSVCTLISTDRTDDSYKKATVNCIDTSAGDYDIAFAGAFAIHGLNFKVGDDFVSQADTNEAFVCYDISIDLAANSRIFANASAYVMFVDLELITNTNNVPYLFYLSNSTVHVINMSVSGTATAGIDNIVWQNTTGEFTCIGSDLSFMTAVDALVNPNSEGVATFIGCTLGTSVPTGNPIGYSRLEVYECDDTTGNSITNRNVVGSIQGNSLLTTTIYRNGGATYDGTNNYSIALSTETNASEHVPFYTDWYNGYLTTSGTKTFTVYINQENGTNLQDDEIWLEVEYFGSASNTQKTIVRDKRTTPLTTAATQTTDATETWTGITTNTRQKLVCASVSVGRAGPFRYRIALGKGSTSNVYVCPKIEVT